LKASHVGSKDLAAAVITIAGIGDHDAPEQVISADKALAGRLGSDRIPWKLEKSLAVQTCEE